jgi:ABC-type molybdate transport system substrate-binding protein
MSYPEIPAGRADDLHNLEHMEDADLVLFMAGNQFMAMEDLLGGFKGADPEIGNIFYETLPPGLEFRQMLAGGAMFRGRLLTGRPDIYTSVSIDAMETLKERGLIDGHAVYLRNRLVLMVAKGNPRGIERLEDLALDDVIVSQPGEMEDISSYIAGMYSEAGGRRLCDRILEEKMTEGTTLPTVVHHRETPSRIISGAADVGPVWVTEVEHARRSGLAVEAVEVGEALDQRGKVSYCAAVMKDAPNPESARRFFDYLLSTDAGAVYASHGFLPLSS